MAASDLASKVKITLTGTGIPIPTANRAGAGVLVSVGSTNLQFDAGRGTVLRLADAGVSVPEVTGLFLTHHHSDHCIDVDDMLLSRWIQRAPALPVIAPRGPLDDFGQRVLHPWREDIRIRREVTGRGDLELDWRSFGAEDREMVVWQNDEVTVSSRLVSHPPIVPAVGYKITTGETTVVVSGDTQVCSAVEEMANNADVLVHEVCHGERIRQEGGDPSVIKYHADARDLGSLAENASVKTLVLTHLLPPPKNEKMRQEYIDQVRKGGYTGEVIVGEDLTTYTIGEDEG